MAEQQERFFAYKDILNRVGLCKRCRGEGEEVFFHPDEGSHYMERIPCRAGCVRGFVILDLVATERGDRYG